MGCSHSAPVEHHATTAGKAAALHAAAANPLRSSTGPLHGTGAVDQSHLFSDLTRSATAYESPAAAETTATESRNGDAEPLLPLTPENLAEHFRGLVAARRMEIEALRSTSRFDEPVALPIYTWEERIAIWVDEVIEAPYNQASALESPTPPCPNAHDDDADDVTPALPSAAANVVAAE